MLGIDQIARLAAEEARKEQNRIDGAAGGAFAANRAGKTPLAGPIKEKVSE